MDRLPIDPAACDLILVLNCGSSSIKFAVFDATHGVVPRESLWNGKVQGVGGPTPDFGETGVKAFPITLSDAHPYRDALELIRQRVVERLEGRRLIAIAHRVVHGGNKYFAPTVVNAAVLQDLHQLIPLAPLHQPFALDAMRILLGERPDIVQIACFDTAFHHGLPQVEQMMALPWAAWERGIRRYGFHGLSYEFVATILAERHGADKARSERIIVAHLGSGASLCALRELRSVATTMGFSALDGLMMGTRCGALDPGAVIYLMEIEKLSLEEVARTLYHESGLFGVSGVSGDPRVLLEREQQQDEEGRRIRAALALYVRRVVREIGGLTAVLGGLDRLVFTAGIGEHNAEIRRRICAELGWLGLSLDEQANVDHETVLSGAASRVAVELVATNEEWVAARDSAQVLATHPGLPAV